MFRTTSEKVCAYHVCMRRREKTDRISGLHKKSCLSSCHVYICVLYLKGFVQISVHYKYITFIDCPPSLIPRLSLLEPGNEDIVHQSFHSLHLPHHSLSQLLTYVVSLLIVTMIVGHAHLPQAFINL